MLFDFVIIGGPSEVEVAEALKSSDKPGKPELLFKQDSGREFIAYVTGGRITDAEAREWKLECLAPVVATATSTRILGYIALLIEYSTTTKEGMCKEKLLTG